MSAGAFSNSERFKSGKEYLYTIDNVAGENSVRGFRIRDNGSLRELRGSPFATGGSGSSAPVFSENGIALSDDQEFLFAVNPGSNDIAVMRIRNNGRLTSVQGSPFPSGGQGPVSVSVSDDILYVSHIGQSGPGLSFCDSCDIRGFRINKRGQLTAIPGSTIEYAEDPAAIPFAIGFNPIGDVLVVTQTTFNPVSTEVNFVNTYNLDRKTGLLKEAPGSPINSVDTQPIGFAFSPVDDSQLFVSAAVDASTNQGGVVTSYLMGENGQIAPLPNALSVSAGGDLGACWLAFTHDGRYFFTTNTFSDTVSRFKVEEDGSMELLGVVEIPGLDTTEDLGLRFPLEIVVTQDDRFSYFVSGRVGSLAGYSVNNGDLTLLPGNAVAIEGNPFGLVTVVKPRRRYSY